MTKQRRVTLHNQPALDTGGVRRQVYTSVYSDFLSNEYSQLFDGPLHHCCPLRTSESRSSGLFKVMGTMVAHSIAQDGIGFPHFSPVCYWYIVGGEERGIEFVSEDGLGGDVAEFVSKVSNTQRSVGCFYLEICNENRHAKKGCTRGEPIKYSAVKGHSYIYIYR